MKLDFDMDQVSTTEFGVGRDVNDTTTFCLVAADSEVQMALREIAKATWKSMEAESSPVEFEAGEKYSATEYVYIKLTDDLAARMRQVHEAMNMPTDPKSLSKP